MEVVSYLLGGLYLLIVFLLSLYGLHSLVNAVLYLGSKIRPPIREKLPGLPDYPKVTVQLPIFNEKYTIERLLAAVTRLRYPAGRLQIQVLDDSTDDTAILTKNLVGQYISRGVDIELIHRVDRRGYKAGALANGFVSASGEFLAIFDADFIPSSDWLMKTIPLFQNQKLGCLQTRWGHTNRKYNSLTRVEALAIDGHFIVEQAVRSRNDFFLNFNGTAGIWRRACIEDAGGWRWDTLTEDLDLSYRAQMRGWKIDYLPDIVVPAELPAHVEAFKNQQFRWAKGSFQVFRKILPRLFGRSKLPWYVRLLAGLHLTGYGVHPLMLGILILTLPVGLCAPQAFHLFPISMIAGFGPPLVFLAAKASHSPSLLERITLLPLLTLTGFGICLNTSLAVFEGLFGKGGVFVRTPKLNLHDKGRRRRRSIDSTYFVPVSRLIWIELTLGVYALITAIVLAPRIGWGIVPWMIVYMLGFFYIGGLSLIQSRESTRNRITKLTPEKSIGIK